MNRLKTIVSTEYLTDVSAKSFWISTILVPVLIVGFGIFVGFLTADSNAMEHANNFLSPTPSADDDLTGWDVMGLMVGLVLTMMIMMNGAQIFNKVRTEKCNRIVEILSTCVDGRTMMLAKILSVFLVSLTQMALWGVMVGLLGMLLFAFSGGAIPLGFMLTWRFWLSLLWALLYFVGGYVFFGSLYAACGAMTDKNGENQEYMTIITFILMGSMYLGMYSVDHADGPFAIWCAYIPFTSPIVGSVRAIACVPVWQTLLSIGSLWFFAWLSVSFAGKVYRSSLLLTGKKLSPSDIITFLKAK